MKPHENAPVCPQCGRTPTFGAQFCPYCGSRLPEVNAQARPAQPVPDRASLTEACAVLYCGQGSVDIPVAGRLVAEAIHRPLGDLTRDIRVSKGLLARKLEAQQARELAEKLEGIGIPVVLVPDADLDGMPRMMRMAKASFTAEGLSCEAYEWDNTVEMNMPWVNVQLISCGQFLAKEVRKAPSENGAEDIEDTGLAFVIKSPANRAKLETRTRKEFVLDVFCAEPDLRLRLDENTAGYALVELESMRGDKRTFYRAAKSILQHAPELPVNDGVRLLADNAPMEFWEPLTFEDKRDFDAYNAWLLQLVRHGIRIPERA